LLSTIKGNPSYGEGVLAKRCINFAKEQADEFLNHIQQVLKLNKSSPLNTVAALLGENLVSARIDST